MFMWRDFDLNSVDMCTDSAHIYTDSLKEVFRKTMLNQEIVFQNQVHELHRLYGMQKMLMQNISWMDLNRYNLTKLRLAHSKGQELLEVQQGLFYKLQQIPCDHELPANRCTGHVGKDNLRDGSRSLLREIVELMYERYFYFCGNVTDQDDLKLSLSIGDGNKRKERPKRTWFDVNLSQNVIDLEESTETTSNEDSGRAPPFSCATSTVISGSRCESLKKSMLTDPITPTTPEKNPSRSTLKRSTFLDDCKRDSFDQDFKRHDGSVLDINLSPEKQQINSSGTWNVDLNKVCCDDSSCYSNDPVVMHPSTASSSHAFHGLVDRARETTWTKESINCSDETSGTTHPDYAGNFTLLNSSSKDESKEFCRAKRPKFGALSGSEAVLALEAVNRQPKAGPAHPNGGHVRDTSESSKSQIYTCAATRAVKYEKKKTEDDVISYSDHSKNTVKDGRGDISLASCEPLRVGDNESSNSETKQRPEEESGNPSTVDPFAGNQRGFESSETLSGEHNLRSLGSSELNGEYLCKEELDKVDDLVRKAAESLVYISLESSTCCQDVLVIDGGSTEMENKERATPEYSVDSFELFTLMLKDCSEDDLCVSSKPPELDFAEKKDYGLQIRRGRRLKDFQRDILPGLASLSRHEIREDMNILEGVLRSREYRKMQAKMTEGNSWCLPARNRRSRLSCVARRRLS